MKYRIREKIVVDGKKGVVIDIDEQTKRYKIKFNVSQLIEWHEEKEIKVLNGTKEIITKGEKR